MNNISDKPLKYGNIPLETVRKCCKQHSYRNKDGKVLQKCEICPLRRTRNHKGQEITLICHYKLSQIIDELMEEYQEHLYEEIQHPEEWDNWILAQDTVD